MEADRQYGIRHQRLVAGVFRPITSDQGHYTYPNVCDTGSPKVLEMCDILDVERLNDGFMSSNLLGYDKRLSIIRTLLVEDSRVPFGHTNLVRRDNISHKRGMSFFETGRMNM